MEWLALSWAGIIAFGIIMYVLLGGFDLGIGILFLFIKEQKQRDLMISTIMPVWDGNQTWLVFGGATLYGAFPLAFSTILPILYMPILVMVLSLLFRGIAIEFRLKSAKTKVLWDNCFCLGSLCATISQGVILGSFVSGFSVQNSSLKLSPFTAMCAFGLICGYILLGADYLIIKTVGELQKKCLKYSTRIQYVIMFCFIAVSIWSPFLDSSIKQRWFDPHNMPILAIFPIATLILFWIHVVSLKRCQERVPFFVSIGMFLMCYAGFIISSYPFMVPRIITYTEAAASDSTLWFMLIGAAILLPVLLIYTYYSYKIFSGKVTKPIGY